MGPRQTLALLVAFAAGSAAGAATVVVAARPYREGLQRALALQVETKNELSRLEQICTAGGTVRGPLDLSPVAGLVNDELRKSFADARAAAARTEAKPAPVPPSEPEGDWQSAIDAQKLVDAAVSSRRWTAEDRERIRALLRDMPVSEREKTMLRIAQHVNLGEIRPSDNQPPY
jgi:hypothetical protein